ncbi:lipopolysaccharide biosynthesis protein [Mycolicibacterium sp. CBM1]
MTPEDDPAITGDGDRRTQDPASSTGRQAAWNYLVFGLSKSSTLIMTVVAARLLDPADFGLFALALLVVNLFDYMKDLGVGAALVQSPRSWNRLAPTGLTLSVIFGVIAGAALALAAPLGAAVLHRPELTPLIRVLAIGLAISALSAIPAARLRRDLDFRQRIWPEFLGAATKSVLTIALAATGYGVWSLVYGQLAGTVVISVLYWWVARTPVRFGFDGSEARGLVRYGASLTGVALLAFAIANIDYLSIGVRLGDSQLGLYTLAYRLPELLVLNLCVVISEVLFSALSRLQDDRERLAEHYLEVMTAAMALSAPISVALAAAAPAVIETMYGSEYAGAASVLVVLSIYTLVSSVSWHAGDVFKAIGRPSLLIATGVGRLLLMAGPIWWAAGHSIVLVAGMLLLVELVPFVGNMLLVRSVAGIPLARLWNAVLRPMPAALGMGVVMLAMAHLARSWPAPLVLLSAATAGILTYVLGLQLSAPELYDAAASAVRSVRRRAGQLPAEPVTAIADAPVVARRAARWAVNILVMLGFSIVVAVFCRLRNATSPRVGAIR